MSTDDLDALIVQNLRDLDAAVKRLDFEIQPRVAKTINGIASNWAKQNKWIGGYDWWEEEDGDGELWVAPPEWRSENNKPGFYLDCGQGDNYGDNPSEDCFWLTRFCRSGNGLICLRWYDFQNLNAKKPEWKKFIKSYVTKIERVGFSYEDRTALFSSAPIIVNAEELARSIVDDTLDQAFKPFHKALDNLIAAKPAFDEMIRAARKEFGSLGD